MCGNHEIKGTPARGIHDAIGCYFRSEWVGGGKNSSQVVDDWSVISWKNIKKTLMLALSIQIHNTAVPNKRRLPGEVWTARAARLNIREKALLLNLSTYDGEISLVCSLGLKRFAGVFTAASKSKVELTCGFL